MAFTVQNIYGFLLRSQLLPPPEAKKMYDRWQAEGKNHADSTDHFLRWLAINSYVTDYQAALLNRGHVDGFFLGPYKILDRLGRGRMAGVYKAVHQLGQVVAIKVLPPSKAKEPPLLARFQREARLALKLNHPHVVRSFQIGEGNGVYYLVMEYLEGETLDETLQRRKKLPPAEAVRVIHQALLGLQHIHEQGLVHRDLKPSNLMLVPGAPESTLTSTVKILDIGLGRAFFDENSPAGLEDPQLTGEGVLLGTPDYLAPEQARNARAADIRADIYSLGCVLYHALSGQPPFPDSNIINQMIRHATETAKPLQEFNRDIPDGLQQIVNWMMVKDAAQRYATPERAAQALQVFLAAGTDAARPAAEDEKMTTFLSWLEVAEKKEPPPDQTPRASPATIKMKRPSSGEAPRKEHRSKHHKKRRHSTLKKAAAAASAPAPSPPVAAPAVAGQSPLPQARVAGLDVELVPLSVPAPPPSPPAAAKPRDLLNLSRRDVIMLIVGAAGGLGAFGVGYLVAQLLGKGTPPPE